MLQACNFCTWSYILWFNLKEPGKHLDSAKNILIHLAVFRFQSYDEGNCLLFPLLLMCHFKMQFTACILNSRIKLLITSWTQDCCMVQGHWQPYARCLIGNPHKNINSPCSKNSFLIPLGKRPEVYKNQTIPLKEAKKKKNPNNKSPGHYQCFKSLKNLKEKFYPIWNLGES